jgi:hypothetical protein
MVLARLLGRLRRIGCGSFVVTSVRVMLMSYCLVTRRPKARLAVGCLAPECWALECWRLRCRWCRRGSHHRLFRCHRNPGCWGRWGLCRARPAPILESRSWRSHTGRLAPRPACSDRLSARRCHATRNRPRAPAPPLPASTSCFPSCGALYPTAHAGDTLTSDGAPSVTSGSEKEAIIACRMPSYRETVERHPRRLAILLGRVRGAALRRGVRRPGVPGGRQDGDLEQRGCVAF